MATRRSGTAGLATIRRGLLASTMLVGVTAADRPALAVCFPAAGNNVVATCTGVTVDQNAPNGYGTGAETNIAVDVLAGASVTGTDQAIAFDTGSVDNRGTLTAGFSGVQAAQATVVNSGTITGFRGVDTSAGATLSNSGTITATQVGISGTTVNVTNSGMISAFSAVFAISNATVFNSGSLTGNETIFANNAVVNNSGIIQGVTLGILALDHADVVNSGTISAADAIRSSTANVTNSGTVTGTNAIRVNTSATVINTGTLSATNNAIAAATIGLTNSGTITGAVAIDGQNVTVANSGLISGTTRAIEATTAVVSNAGRITGATAISVTSDAHVNNSGTIQGVNEAVLALGHAEVVNSGSISGANAIRSSTANVSNAGTITGTDAIRINTATTVVNSGTISGTNIGIRIGFGHVTNAGLISGGNGTALLFSGGLADSLTVLPGARFGGLVDFGGGADRVTFGAGSWSLGTAQFDAAQSTVLTGGRPFVVLPDRIIVADLSGIAAADRALTDVTGWIAGLLPDWSDQSSASAATGFAPEASLAHQYGHVFAALPESASAYASVFKSAAMVDRDGNTLWSKGFGGYRRQGGDTDFIGSVTQGWGGAFGYERYVRPDLRVGAFLGASHSETDLELGAGGVETDAIFAGLHGGMRFGATFLDLALIGGHLASDQTRTIGGGLVPEVAQSRYDGWFFSPVATLGHRFALTPDTTLTPALKGRYVGAHFDGYTETGSSANLTVGARETHDFEGRAELAFARTTVHGAGSRLTARVTGGALTLQRAGDRDVATVLAGQSFVTAAGHARSVAGLYAGAGFDWQSGRFVWFASGEITGTSDDTTTVAGKAGLRFGW